MASDSMGSTNEIGLNESKLPWGEDIWQSEGSWFTLAQLLWVKLYGSSMSYGQLHYVKSTPLLPVVSSTGQITRRGKSLVQDTRPRVHEMELVMDPARGILLVGEVYGRPGDRVWQPDKIYSRMLELGVVLAEFFQRELLDEHKVSFCPGLVLILRDIERPKLTADSVFSQLNTITRDELRIIQQHLNDMMDIHASSQEIPFHTYGHMLIAALRNISDNTHDELGGFRTADEIYQVPCLPVWLR